MDYEKAFDIVERQTLWKLLRHCGIPEKIPNIIRNSYEGMTWGFVHGRQLTDAFEVKPEVRQGCLLSPVMFLLTMDGVVKTSTAQGRNGIQWTLWKQLDDLDYADDLALLSHMRHQMQEKTSTVAGSSAGWGPKIHRGKIKVLKVNTATDTPIMIEGEVLDELASARQEQLSNS